MVSPRVNPELAFGHEDISPTPEEYEGIVNGLANHEAKLLTMAIVGNEPTPFTRGDIQRAIYGIQGPEPGWRVSSTTPFKYLEKSLAPIGLVAKLHIDTSTKPTEAYSATPLGRALGLAASGALLDWSLQYDELSLQAVLGSSQSVNDNRAPAMRLNIVRSILTAPERVVGVSALHERYPQFNRSRILKIQNSQNIFELTSCHQESYDRSFHIKSIDYSEGKYRRTVGSLQPVRQAIYDGIKRLSDRDITGSSIAELIDEIAAKDQNVDLAEVRNVLLQAASRRPSGNKNMELPLIVFDDRKAESGIDDGEHAVIGLKAEYVEACKSLLQVFDNFQMGRNVQFYRNRTREILADEDLCAELMAKARDASPRASRWQRGTSIVDEVRQVLAQGRESGYTVRDVQESLVQDRNVHYAKNSINRALGELSLMELVDVAERTHGSGRKRSAKVYWLRSESSDHDTQ